MSLRANPFRAFPVFLAFLFNIVLGPLAPVAQLVSSPAVALTGTSFNATDGNLTDDSAPEVDWCTASLGVITKDDLPTGQTDNSYKSAKENELDPEVEFGSIPNNKVDLQRLYVSSETTAAGDLFVYVGWIRNDTTGTGTISFEMNQSDVVMSNGINHQRTVGDLLIEFNFQANPGSQGGYEVELAYREWDGTEWGDAIDLAGLAEGSVNDAAVVDCRNGNANLPTGSFGEFSLNLTDLLGGDCRAFGSLFAKSRSSNVITSELKEVMAPIPVDFSTCSTLKILKEDQFGDPVGGATFTITPDPFNANHTGSLDVLDDTGAGGYSGADSDPTPGVIQLDDVEPYSANGGYQICEKSAPNPDYVKDSTCITQVVGNNTTVTFGPFVNELLFPVIRVEKTPDEDAQNPGANDINAGDAATFTVSVYNDGTGEARDVMLFDDLPGSGWSVVGAQTTLTSCAVTDPSTGPYAALGEVLTCGPDDIAAAGSAKVTVTKTASFPADCGSIDNTASVTLSNGDGDSDAGNIDVLCASLALAKTPDLPGDAGGTVNAGEVATFTLVLSNNGNGVARNASITDYTLPATDNGWNLGNANDEGSCTLDVNDKLDCSFGDLAAGASRTVKVWTTTTLEDCGALSNPLASGHSSNDGNPTDSGSIFVTCPELQISKSTTTPVVTAGDQVFYTVEVQNNGDGDAENVVISDTLPAGITWSEASPDCSISGGTSLSCTVDIPAGESFSVTVSGWTDAGDCPSILNRATFTSDNAGSGASHPQGQGVQITINCPDVGVSKTADDGSINAGDDAEYTITVTAGGTGTSTNVTLHDDLPPVDGTWSAQIVSPDGDDECLVSGDDLDCTFGDMASGAQKVVHLSVATTPDDCGTLLNDVSVDADVNLVTGNDTVSDVEIEVACPDIVVDKTGSGTVNATDSVFFEITVSNDGDGDAYDFAFTDTLPDIEGSWTLVAPVEPGCALAAGVLTCSKEVFEAGDSFTLRVEADTQFEDCGDLDNLASASASNESDEDLDNNADDHTIVVECPDLSASKDADGADPEVVSAGQPIGFTITVENADESDTGTAYDVEINDPLPAGSGLDWDIDPDWAGPGTCEITGAVGAQVLECSFGDLEPGDSVSVHLVSDTSKADCATYPNVADVTADNHPELNPSDDVTVECPGLNISKVADASPIDAGELASYTIVVWNAGPGTALDATWSDELPAGVSWGVQLQNPDGDDSCISGVDSEGNQSVSCSFGDLAVSSKADGKLIVISGMTDREDCGVLDNTAFASASNADTVQASASIDVKCPTVAIEKINDQPIPVLPGTVVSYSLTVTVSDGPAKDVVVTDVLPAGLDAPASISDGGTYDGTTRTITWNLGDLDNGSHELTYQAAVSADAEQGDELVNLAVVTSPNSQCPDDESLADECDDDSTVTVRVPSLVIDKAADTEIVHFVFDADGNVKSVDPAQVTWTLTYTLANGPVTSAVITDPLPDFLVFVSASDGGVYDATTGTITWNLGTLTSSGSVTFVTTVDPDAPETEPILNVATIDSNETAPDDGQDSITVTSESEQGGNPTPTPSVPDTALVIGPSGQPVSIPIELLVLVFAGSLGALALANVRAVRRRR